MIERQSSATTLEQPPEALMDPTRLS